VETGGIVSCKILCSRAKPPCVTSPRGRLQKKTILILHTIEELLGIPFEMKFQEI